MKTNPILLVCVCLSEFTWAADSLAFALRAIRNAPHATARAVETTNGRELLLVGSVPLERDIDYFHQQVRAIERFKQGGEVIAVRAFRAGDAASEISRAPIPAAEFDGLRNCRVWNCSWRMPAEWIERLHREVDWKQPAAREAAAAIVREEMAGLLSRYRRFGISGLARYADKPKVIDMSAEAHELIEASAGLLDPELMKHIARYPHNTLANTEDVFYWSLEKMGPKPVFSITHMTLHRTRNRLYVVSRQIYGNHYLDGAISVTTVESDPSRQGRSRLEFISRTRIGLLEGAFARVRRALVVDAVRKTMERYLGEIAARLKPRNDELLAASATAAPRD